MCIYMNISDILLFNILCILIVILINSFFTNEFLTNNLPNNNIVAMGESNLLIPTSDQVYNPYDSNRTNNELSHQETSILNNNAETNIANTSIDVPIIYSKDELDDTTIKHNHSPSYIHKIIDAGSGNIDTPIDINNNVLNNLKSIE
jgi:hypothetical protein